MNFSLILQATFIIPWVKYPVHSDYVAKILIQIVLPSQFCCDDVGADLHMWGK